MLHPIFGHNSFYVKFKAPNHEQLTNFVLNKEENYDDFGWTRNCELHTILCKWQETTDLFQPSVHKFSESIGKKFSCTLYDPWINCYKRNSFQEIHDHSRYDIACVFFPEVKEDFSKFFFYDRFGSTMSKSWVYIFDGPTNHYPSIESGDILFFPGNMLHGVTPHKSDTVRKTISCNLNFDIIDTL